jgi:hypothetical protein
MEVFYPPTWTLGKNLDADCLEQDIIAWLDESGLLPTPSLKQKVQKMEIGAYTGLSHPFGTYAQALVYGKYITLWLLWDDVVIEKQASEQHIRETIQALSQGKTSSSNPYVQAWAQLSLDFQQASSPKWIRRLSWNMLQWLLAAKVEAKMPKDGGDWPLSKLLHQRLITIGMMPTIQMLELVAGLDLDVKTLNDPGVQKCMTIATTIVALVNELMSVGKDTRSSWANLINITAKQRQWSIQQSFDYWRQILQQTFERYDGAAALLPLNLQPWLQLLRSCSLGFAHWHTLCPRYLNHQPPELRLVLLRRTDF